MTQDSTAVQSVTAAIDHFAAKLQVPAGHVWRTLQLQARVEFYQSLGWVAVWIFAGVSVAFLWRTAFRAVATINAGIEYRNSHEGISDHPEWLVPLVTLTLFAGIGLFLSLGMLSDGVGYLLNPDYYALVKIAKVFK